MIDDYLPKNIKKFYEPFSGSTAITIHAAHPVRRLRHHAGRGKGGGRLLPLRIPGRCLGHIHWPRPRSVTPREARDRRIVEGMATVFPPDLRLAQEALLRYAE
ncbi:hypothetical protein GCM10009069_05360 [Algimonas arctica]|uniref:Uncharacterized protein n=1 Tax=Algimonas arctica TaxID=1479486 RepID=A0A8J3G1D2_9PROT|nr:hypothetical protein GCM10009069_05360 [Algimonas arctica]